MSNAHLRDRRRDDQVRQAGHQGGRLPRLGQGGRREGARRRRDPLRRRRAGLRRLLLRRLDLRPAGALPARPHRDPGRQRQQQLLDRLLGALPRPPGGPRRRSPTARSRSASRRWRRARSGSSTPTAPTRSTSTRSRCSRCASRRSRRRRRRCSATPGATTWRSTAPSPTTTPGSAGRTTSTRSTTPTPSSRTSTRSTRSRSRGMIHEPLTKLQCSPTSDGSACAIVASERYVDEHDLWRPGDRDRRPGDGHRPLSTVRRRHRLHQDRRLRHVEAGGRRRPTRRPASPRRGRRVRAPRLLLGQRADHLRGARLRRRGRGPQAGRGRGDDLRRRRPGRQPLRRPDLQGPPARRHRARAVLGAHLAAARRRRRAPGRRREGRAPAQHRPRRRGRRLGLQAGDRSTNERRGMPDEHDHRRDRAPSPTSSATSAPRSATSASASSAPRSSASGSPAATPSCTARRSTRSSPSSAGSASRSTRPTAAPAAAWSTPASSSRRRCAAWSRSPATGSA